MLVFVAVITWIASFIVERFGIALIFQTITTMLLVCRLRAIRVKFNKFIIFEVLGLVIPTLISLLLKRFDIFKTIEMIVIRGLFCLYVKYDYENYRYFTKTFINEELDNE